MDETWTGDLLKDRQVVPRWHSARQSALLGERNASASARVWSPRALHWATRLREESESHLTPFSKLEATETQFVLGLSPEPHPDLIAKWGSISKGLVLGAPQAAAQALQREISDLKERLRREPGQSLLWADLARCYTTAGLDKKAQRAMQIALNVSGDSIYLRRAASRMYLHTSKNDLALSILRQSAKIQKSPQLIAAEIAVANATGRTSKFAALGKRILSDKSYSARSLSEVAAAVATLELKNGKHKAARQLFSQSMLDPTENALAQAQWATKEDKRIVIPDSAWNTPHNFEATVLRARLEFDWDRVTVAARGWLDDEPYSSRPAAVGSFACFTLEQNASAEELSTRALFSTPNSVGLLNNRSVARSYLGKLDEAEADIRSALAHGGEESPHLLATLGLLAYRRGDAGLGALCYSSAISWFLDKKSNASATLALLYWIRETMAIDPQSSKKDLAFVKENVHRMTGGQDNPEIHSMLQYLESFQQKNGTGAQNADGSLLPANSMQLLLGKFSIPTTAERRRERYLQNILKKA